LEDLVKGESGAKSNTNKKTTPSVDQKKVRDKKADRKELERNRKGKQKSNLSNK
jgi:hypothetical protein